MVLTAIFNKKNKPPPKNIPCDPHPTHITQGGDSPQCSICLSRPKMYGLLSGCSDSFCLPCITTYWNRYSVYTDRKCPVCRTVDFFIIPSRIFLSSEDERKKKKIKNIVNGGSERVTDVVDQLNRKMTR